MNMYGKIREKTDQHIMQTYNRLPIVLVEGKGAKVWDVDGKEYLDFLSGLGVDSVGHCHPEVVAAIQDQAAKLLHVSNLYYTEPQANLAELLMELSPFGQVFFANSGAEANEAAIKLARYWGKDQGRFRIITAWHSFHGRTLATITATGQPKYHKGFEPMMPGFTYVPFGDLVELEKNLSDDVCAIMLEAIQGEGGVNVSPPDYLQEVRRLCDDTGILLIMDEVQSGLGRTGKWFAFEHFDIIPDICTLAKALGGGLPIGAMLAKEDVALLEPGTHASTFGGNPVACAAAIAVISIMQKEGLLEKAKENGGYLMERLRKVGQTHSVIQEVRGKGLMVGVEFSQEVGPLVSYFQRQGVLVGTAGPRVLRFLPPLIISRREIDKVIDILLEWLTQAE